VRSIPSIFIYAYTIPSGTELEDLSVAQTVISATKQQILAFNYASQALNNSFFLDNLVRIPVSNALNADGPSYRNHQA
jgi:hypothetical protein